MGRNGYHAALAYRPESGVPMPAVSFETTGVDVDGQPAELVSCTGAFAAGRLDVGAAALIQGMRVMPQTRVLDLGCGTGLVGLAALLRGADVIGTDVSARAVASTRRTWDRNGFAAAPAYLCSGAAAVPDCTIDTVVTNPPFHRGHDVDFEVARHFVREAARVLKPQGTLYLVANTFLDYAPWLEAGFRAVTVAWEDTRFRVWSATR